MAIKLEEDEVSWFWFISSSDETSSTFELLLAESLELTLSLPEVLVSLIFYFV